MPVCLGANLLPVWKRRIFRSIGRKKRFPVGDILPLASAKSAGETIEFNGKSYRVEELTESVFNGRDIDIAFFSAGGGISAKYARYAVEAGAVVIDNTSQFRMEDRVPLLYRRLTQRISNFGRIVELLLILLLHNSDGSDTTL